MSRRALPPVGEHQPRLADREVEATGGAAAAPRRHLDRRAGLACSRARRRRGRACADRMSLGGPAAAASATPMNAISAARIASGSSPPAQEQAATLAGVTPATASASARPSSMRGARTVTRGMRGDARWMAASVACPYHRPMTSQTDTDLSAAAQRGRRVPPRARRRAPRAARRVPLDPERQRRPGAGRRGPPHRAVDRRRDDAARDRARHGPRDEPPSDRHRRVDARRSRRADRARLLPLRRPAHRPARRVDPPAVRAAPRGRARLRPRRRRRQGPAVHAPQGGRGLDGRRRPAAAQPALLLRG